MSAGHFKDQESPGLNCGGKVLLEQIWDLKGCRGVQVHSDTSASIFAGKSVFLPPKEWVRVFLPYKLHIEGGVTVVCGLQRPGLVAGLAVTKGGQLRLNIWNSKEEAVQLTPKTTLVNVAGAEVSVRHFGEKEAKVGKRQRKRDVKNTSLVNVATEQAGKIHDNLSPDKGVRLEKVDERRRDTQKPEGSARSAMPVDGEGINLEASELPRMELLSSDIIEQKIREMFPKVGDLSSHPVNDKMRRMVVKKEEVTWSPPTECGVRTQYSIENVADRRLVAKQLGEYVQRGYLKEVSVADPVYLSPLLPVRKPNGTFRFTNDFRKLNSYFRSVGTSQVDVWRKLWELKPEWRFFMEIDLKDGFFGIPVDEELSRLFGFTYGTQRFIWVRLPQGWKWSSVLFGERIAEILKGLDNPQYSDNVLVGAETPEILLGKAIEVFRRFDEFGVKVNYDKVKWVSTKISFLGYEVEGGKMTLKGYIQRKREVIGEVRTIHDLERVIGIISYARRVIRKTEEVLAPLRADLKAFKKGETSTAWFRALDSHIQDAFEKAFENMEVLTLPGGDPSSFELETDWSGGFSGYMLFANLPNDEKALVDIGSRANVQATSSYLGELETIVWACKKTKAYRGSLPLTIRTDSHGVMEKSRAGALNDDDVRSFRRWAWLMANEPGFELEFKPGAENCGADLLSRPHVEKKSDRKFKVNGLSDDAQGSLCTRMWETDHLGIRRLKEEAKIPKRMTEGAAGYDLSSCERTVVPPWGKALIRTGIALRLPNGTYGRIAPRSGLALKHSIAVGAGVIDQDYSGEVGVILFNHSGQDFTVNKGDRIAQLILEEIKTPEVVELFSMEDTERGMAGFGSTGTCNSLSTAEMEEIVWEEHLVAHWGAWKVYKALRRKGYRIPMRIVKKITDMCEVCAKFRGEVPRDGHQPAMHSLQPGGVVYADVIGPLPPVRGGAKYIHCIVDSATRILKVDKLKVVNSARIIKSFESWIKLRGRIGTVVTDNAAYYSSEMMNSWCKDNGIEHKFNAPYRHQSMGIVERYNRTLEDRLRKLMLAHGGSWADHLEHAEKSINESVHQIMGFSPNELWEGGEDIRKKAKEKLDAERDRRNKSIRKFPAKFWVGKNVLVRQYDPNKQGKLDPLWKGPYKITEKISNTMWRARKYSSGPKVGRKPTEVFHQDQMQPFEL